MTSLQFTGTTDINKTTSWKFAKKHAEHDPNVNHKNQNINSNKTHLNAHYIYADKDELLENHWHDYIEDHDQKMIARRDKKKCYGTAENYFNQKGKKLDSTTVSTFGNVDQWNDLKKVVIDRCGDTPETEQRLANAVNNGVDSYVQAFNDKYESFQITEALTNIDEAGAPHFHGQMVNLGTTKTGRPSASFDRALLQATGDPDSKTRLSTFRQQTDGMLVASMGLNFAREFSDEFPEWTDDINNKKSPFEFIRTNSQSVGVDHDVYVQTKTQATRDAQQENKRLKSENDALTLQIAHKRAKLDDLDNNIASGKVELQNINSEAQQAFDSVYSAKVSELQQRQQEQDEREKEQDKRDQQQQQREHEFLTPFANFLNDVDPDSFIFPDDARVVVDPTESTTLQDFNPDKPALSGMPAVMHYATASATNTQKLQRINNKVQQQQTRKSKQKEDDLEI